MNRSFLSIVSTLLLMLLITGCTGSTTKSNIIEGTVFISGNEPFTYLALKTQDDKYFKLNCEDELQKELWSMQGQVVKLHYKDLEETSIENVVTVIKILSK